MSQKKESRGDEEDLKNIRDILINTGLNDNHEEDESTSTSEDEKLYHEQYHEKEENTDTDGNTDSKEETSKKSIYDKLFGGKNIGDGLYTDHNFKQSLHGYFSDEQVIWRRIKDVDGRSNFYEELEKIPVALIESRIGTCALSSAVQLIIGNKEIFDKVVPKTQNFKEGYNGSFTFRFWKHGSWETITVDDFMPYDYKYPSEPLFSMMDCGHCYWFSLLEKAYAKFYGKYSNLFCVTLDDALLDLTGGVVESYDIDGSKTVDTMLNQSFINNSLIGLIVKDNFVFKVLGQRIASNEVYRLEEIMNEKEIFYKISKPLNVLYEHSRHNYLSTDLSSLHQYIGDKWKTSGENVLSIPIDLIKKYFKSFKIITVPTFDTNAVESDIKIWKSVNRNGSWTVKNAGGSPQFLQTFWKNPQYRFKILSSKPEDCCIIIIEVSTHRMPSAMGFSLYDIKCLGDELNSIELNEQNCKLIGNHELDGKRNITKRFKLLTGFYALVPYTSLPDTQGNFFIRIFHDSFAELRMSELNIFENVTSRQLLEIIPLNFNFCRITKVGFFTGIIAIIYYLYIYTE